MNKNYYEEKRKRVKNWALQSYEKYKNDSLFMLGLGLYIGEGDKTNGSLAITNMDSKILITFRKWVDKYMIESKYKWTGYLHVTVSEWGNKNKQL